MTSRRLLASVVLGSVLTFLVGFVSGQSRRLSIDLWLVITTVWLGWLILGEVRHVAPVRSDRLRGVWRRQPRRRPVDGRPTELVKLEGLLLNSLRSDRATRTRLRPRLTTLCDHVLLAEYGIDRSVHPERVAEVFAEVAWLADPDAEVERSPTTVELEQLLAMLSSDQNEPRNQQG